MTSETKEKQELLRKKRLQEWTTHGFLIALVICYSFMGAKLFQSIEQKHEERVKINLIETKHRLINQAAVGLSGKVDKKNWTQMVERLIGYYVEDLAQAAGHGIDILDVNQHETESDSKWDFWGSLFYAGTVYTTIGYGNIAPATPEGKVMTILYGILGIPLCLILLADLAKVITRTIRHTVKFCKKKYYTCSKHERKERWPPQSEIDTMTGQSSLVILLGLCLIYLFGGAFMYRHWEDEWTYLDAVYFIFVTTSTIGFGDVLPNHPLKFMFTSLYIFIGLSLVSTGFTIIQEMIEGKIAETKTQLDQSLGIAETEETADHSKPPATNNNTKDSVDTALKPLENTGSNEAVKPIPQEIVEEAIQEEVIKAVSAKPTAVEKKQSNLRNWDVGYQPTETRVLQDDDRNISIEATIYL